MSLYNLPKFEFSKIKPSSDFLIFLVYLLISFLGGALGGFIFSAYLYQQNIAYIPNSIQNPLKPQVISQEQEIIKVVKEVSPAVVSIIITKDLPVFEEHFINPFEEFKEFFRVPFEFKIPKLKQKGIEKKEIGGGTGFIVSEDGLVLTNKHVVQDKEADYTVLTNDGKIYKANILASDPRQDLAILKIEKRDELKVAKLGNSDNLDIGQTVIAIGNVLGEFRNSVSLGVISGLGRKITATGGGFVETLEDVIQTDAAINKGNSGGPLLNLRGEVIGINTAMALGAENIGFAIPINKAKKSIEQVQKFGKIVYPFLGIYYTIITKELKEQFNLPVDYGAWVGRDNLGRQVPEPIFENSPAQKIGIRDNDIILEFNNEKITTENSLAKIISNYEPGAKISLKILRDNQEIILDVVLGEKTE